MMSPDSLVAKPGPEEGPSAMEAGKMAPPRPPDEQLRCPRCDSPNTKFCYYNNYSLTQPRYFCKTCRRYWTKGGALRNVPIGGGCRKSKKSKSAASKDPSPTSSDSSTGLNFLHGLNPAVEFQLGSLPFSRLTTHSTTPFNQFFAFSDLSSSSSASPSTPSTFETSQNPTNPLIGFHHSLSSIQRPGEGITFGGGVQEVGSNNLLQQSSIASSIESLSSINQDLHIKLQQHRLAMLYGSENQKLSHLLENQQQPTSFQVEQSPKVDAFGGGDSRKGCDDVNIRESLFGNSYNGNSNNNSNSNYNTSSWNEIQTWGDLHQYNPLP